MLGGAAGGALGLVGEAHHACRGPHRGTCFFWRRRQAADPNRGSGVLPAPASGKESDEELGKQVVQNRGLFPNGDGKKENKHSLALHTLSNYVRLSMLFDFKYA